MGLNQLPIHRGADNKDTSQLSTIIVRGSTDNIMDDFERSVDDAVNTYKQMCRVCAGGGMGW